MEIGDYVTYDATSGQGSGLSITASDIDDIVQTIDNSTSESNLYGGVTINGTFSSGDITKWRVVGKKDGIVKIVGERPAPTIVRIQGIDGFRHAEDVLDKICSIFGKGNGATEGKSIKLDDLDLNYNNIIKGTNGTELGDKEYTSGNFLKQIRKDGKVIDYENVLTEANADNPITITNDSFSVFEQKSFNNSNMFPMLYKITMGHSFWTATRAVETNTEGANFGIIRFSWRCHKLSTNVYLR